MPTNSNKVSWRHDGHLGKPWIILKQKTSKGSSCWTKGKYSGLARKRLSSHFPFLCWWLRWVWCTRAPHRDPDVHDLDLPNTVWAPTSQLRRTEMLFFTLHPIYKLSQKSLKFLEHLVRRWNSALPQTPWAGTWRQFECCEAQDIFHWSMLINKSFNWVMVIWTFITSPLAKGMNTLFVELSPFLLYFILPWKTLVFQSIARRPKSSTLANPSDEHRGEGTAEVSYPCWLTEYGIKSHCMHREVTSECAGSPSESQPQTVNGINVLGTAQARQDNKPFLICSF